MINHSQAYSKKFQKTEDIRRIKLLEYKDKRKLKDRHHGFLHTTYR